MANHLVARLHVHEVLVGHYGVAAKVGADQSPFRPRLGNGLQRRLTDIIMWLVDIQESIHTNGERAVVQGDITAVREQCTFHAACQ